MDDLIQHVVGVRRGKIVGELALDVIGVLIEVLKHRAVEDKRLDRARSLPKDLEKRLPKINPDPLRAQTQIIRFLQQH